MRRRKEIDEVEEAYFAGLGHPRDTNTVADAPNADEGSDSHGGDGGPADGEL